MNVEFSLSQLPPPWASAQAYDGVGPPPPGQAKPPEGVAGLRSVLNDLALTRPDKMDAGRPLVLSANYPPEKLFNSIAHLLAIHFTN